MHHVLSVNVAQRLNQLPKQRLGFVLGYPFAVPVLLLIEVLI